MPLDIIIFAAIAFALVLKLKSVLGTRNEDDLPPRKNPFAQNSEENVVPIKSAQISDMPIVDAYPIKAVKLPLLIKPEWVGADKDDAIKEGLQEIADADDGFDLEEFMEGATAAFEMIVEAYGEGDIETLEPLLGQKLFEDFSSAIQAMKEKGQRAETNIRDVVEAKITEAHMGGLMAYVTIRFLVEQSACVKDENGQVIDGDPDKAVKVENIWTFTRDSRSEDPNWILIKTQSAEA